MSMEPAGFAVIVSIWTALALPALVCGLAGRDFFGRVGGQPKGPRLPAMWGWFLMELPALATLPAIYLSWGPPGGRPPAAVRRVGGRRPAGGSLDGPLRSPHAALAVAGAAGGQSAADGDLRGGIRVQRRQRAAFRLVSDKAGGLSGRLVRGYALRCGSGGHGAGSGGEHLGGLSSGKAAARGPGPGRPACQRPVPAGVLSQPDGGDAGVGRIRVDVLVAAGAVLRHLDLGEPDTASLVETPVVSPAVRKLPEKPAGGHTGAAVI